MKVEMLKRHFERRLLPLVILRRMVAVNLITADQFKEITGKDF